MNILDSALNQINSLVALQKINIETYEIQNLFGMANEVLLRSEVLYTHIQPITPQELKKFSDSTIDSINTFKFFFSGNQASVLHSFNQKLENSYIVWNEKKYKVYAIRDWFLQNGWVAVYGTLINSELENDTSKNNI